MPSGFQAKRRNHPNAYKRKDGKTKCPDCHALTLDAVALESLPCIVPPEEAPPKEKEAVHIQPLPPTHAKVGDLWIDTSNVLRMLVLDRMDKEGPETGLWIDIVNREGPWRSRGVAVAAPWKQGYNPEVKEVGLTKEVTHFKAIEAIEQQYYEMEMLKALDQWLDDHEMLAVTLPQFDLEQNISRPSATIRTVVMARPIPEPITDTQLKPMQARILIGDKWEPTTGALHYDTSTATLRVNVGDRWVPVHGYSPTGHPIA